MNRTLQILISILAFAMITAVFPVTGLTTDDANQYEVTVTKDVGYYSGPGFSPAKHTLDIYSPNTENPVPVLVVFHGGGWVTGDKKDFADIAKGMASFGYCVVVFNHRLYPKVRFPEMIKDGTRAVAWIHNNISKHGGNREKLFLVGHSSGAHMAALLATNKTFLGSQNIPLKNISGVVGISGAYRIERGVHPHIFTKNDYQLNRASPYDHVGPETPPFLILYAGRELPTIKKQGKLMASKLRLKGKPVAVKEFPGRNHGTIAVKIGTKSDPVTQEIIQFLNTQD